MTELGRTPPDYKLPPTPKQDTVLVAYHADCIDGFTSAVICYEALKDKGYKVSMTPMRYNESSDRELLRMLTDHGNRTFDSLYIVDFSLSPDMLYKINCHTFTKVIILDHHKTAFEKYMPEDYVVTADSFAHTRIHGASVYLDNAKSGAGMCWSYFHPNSTMPMMVQYVQDHDLWRFSLGEPTKWVNKYLMTQDKEIGHWLNLLHGMEEPAYLAVILENGRQLQEVHDQKVMDLSGNSAAVTLLGYNGLFQECDRDLTSDLGQALANISGTFGLMFDWPDDAEDSGVTFSLRSNGDFDVSAMAKQFGGGGHKNAAGFTVCLEEAIRILESKVGISGILL
jgi:oligoribonuclease NrnB/cAMP/cGMP phosphodiesterase (DHH superfamily)